MKSLYYFIFIIIIFFFTLVSCSSAPVIVNENTPNEETAQIYIQKSIHLISYNGNPIPVKKALNNIGYVSQWFNIFIPSGEIEFLCGIQNKDHYGKDFLFKYKFEPGAYTLHFDRWGGADEKTPGISIYEGIIKFSPKKEKVKAFVPFYK